MEQADLVQALWGDLGIDRTALVAHDYGVSVAQELLSRDAGRIESMAWLNGGMFPDLHHPTEFQRHLTELSGEDAEDYITETVYRKALLVYSAERSQTIGSARCGLFQQVARNTGGSRIARLYGGTPRACRTLDTCR
jgi:pimeloyl-ACP methyl ester carboxylesterase